MVGYGEPMASENRDAVVVRSDMLLTLASGPKRNRAEKVEDGDGLPDTGRW